MRDLMILPLLTGRMFNTTPAATNSNLAFFFVRNHFFVKIHSLLFTTSIAKNIIMYISICFIMCV